MVDVSYSPSPDSSSKETHYLDDQSKLKSFCLNENEKLDILYICLSLKN